ncbi:hypothetical protein C7457_1028 [Thermovibrio guaymasensis]|uniref:Uncharacterized protein n=1 Tax=Thermovibrio guaymasensis TaxID=240167 RepID=A0A420W659_9BACT|nr:SIMPL domain-containing protein [Thermovibrio guaymasensis]RKQ61592.1 hypothetical protein C7457_1028 [Thermovibrio guaymasensis]
MMWLATLLTFILVGTSYGTTISDSITVWEWTQPDSYKISITVKARGNREEEVLKALQTADDYLRRTELEYTGGNFSLWPVREWDPQEKRYVDLGFRGSCVYTFHLKSPKEQGKIFKALEEAQGISSFKYTVNSTKWEVSWEKRERTLQKLKSKALKEILFQSNRFGKILKEKCTLKEVSFSPKYSPSFSTYKLVRTPTTPAPQPKRSPERIELKASYKLECNTK